MILGRRSIEVINALGRKRVRQVLIVRCDQCGCEFERKFTKVFEEQDFHFHSKRCSNLSKANGVLKEKTSATNMKKYNVKSTLRTSNAVNKLNAVINENKDQIVKKRKNTILERFGPAGLKSKAVRNRATLTSRRKYGTDYYSQTQQYKDKCRETSLKKYQVESPSKSSVVIDKMKATCNERYGFDWAWQNDEIKDKIRQACNRKYGVDYISQVDAIKQKKHNTMKRNSTYGKSRPECELYDVLCSMFGVNDIERQHVINGWAIDFYIKSVDLYVQLDGAYWHGLDRPIDEIKKFKTSRDRTIYTTYVRDREQEAWFKNNHLVLVRGVGCKDIIERILSYV